MQRSGLPARPPYALKSVDRSLQLIQMLRDNGFLRVSDAAAELQVSASTAHRLLSMLVYRGFAIQDEARVYLPGPSMGEGAIRAGSLDLKRTIQPHLEMLCERTGETANLMIRVGGSVRFIATVESAAPTRTATRRGLVLSAADAAGGKALLSELDEPSIRRLYADSGMSSRAIERLLSELKRVRKQGFATNIEATERGVCGVGVVIRYDGIGIAGISVALRAARFSEALRAGLVEELIRSREAIETALLEQAEPGWAHA